MSEARFARVRALLDKKFEYAEPIMLCGAHGATNILRRPLSCSKCRHDVMTALAFVVAIGHLHDERMLELRRELDRLEASLSVKA